jgi:hypothetical protein
MLPVDHLQKRKTFYNELTKDNWKLPAPDNFWKQMKNPIKRYQFYGELIADQWTLPDFESWQEQLGFEPVQQVKITEDQPAKEPTFNEIMAVVQRSEDISDVPGVKQMQQFDNMVRKSMMNFTIGAFEHGIRAGEMIGYDPSILLNVGYNVLTKPYGEPSGVTLPYVAEYRNDILSDAEKWYDRSKQRRIMMELMHPTDYEMSKTFLYGDIPQGIGTSLGFLATAYTMGPLASVTLGAFGEAQVMWEEALDYGASFETADVAATRGYIIGAVEGLTFEHIFARMTGLNPVIKRSITNGLMRFFNLAKPYAAKGFISGIEEGLQETIQTLGENYTAKELYDFGRDLTVGLERSAGAGFVTGMVMSMVFGAMANQVQNARTEELREKAWDRMVDLMNQKYRQTQVHHRATSLNQKLNAINLKSAQADEKIINKTISENSDMNILGIHYATGVNQGEKEAQDNNQSVIQDLGFLSNAQQLKALTDKLTQNIESTEDFNNIKQEINKMLNIPGLGASLRRDILNDLAHLAILRSKPAYEYATAKYQDIDIKSIADKVLATSFGMDQQAIYLNAFEEALNVNLVNRAAEIGNTISDEVIFEPEYLDTEDISNLVYAQKHTSKLEGNNIQEFKDVKTYNVTSTFDKWLDKLQGKLDLRQPFKVKGLPPYGQELIEQFRQEYLSKVQFRSVPKERIKDFKRDWNNWLKENFGLRHAKGVYGSGELYGLRDILTKKAIQDETFTIGGSEVIISGDYLFANMPHTYDIGETVGAGLGWYIYADITKDIPFIYEFQSDILPELFGKSVSSTIKFMDTEREKLTTGHVRITSLVTGETTYHDAPLPYNAVLGSPTFGSLGPGSYTTAKNLKGKYVPVWTDKTEIMNKEIADALEEGFNTSDELRSYIGLNLYGESMTWEGTSIRGTAFAAKHWTANTRYYFKTMEEFEKFKETHPEVRLRTTLGKEITKKEFEEAKKVLETGRVEESLQEFTGRATEYLPPFYKGDIVIDESGEEHEVVFTSAGYPPQYFPDENIVEPGEPIEVGIQNKEGKITYYYDDEIGELRLKKRILRKEPSKVIPTLQNLYSRYWTTMLMHSFMYAKNEHGKNVVWLPTAEAMEEIEGSKRTAKMYTTKYDVGKRFKRVGPYWTALSKIKGIKLSLGHPAWSKVPLIKADISEVDTEAISLFQKGKDLSKITSATNLNKPTPNNSYKELLTSLPERATIEQVYDFLSENDMIDPATKGLLQWMMEKNPRQIIRIGHSKTNVNNKTGPVWEMGSNYAAFVYNPISKESAIILNRDAQSQAQYDIHESIMHEMTHGVTFRALDSRLPTYDPLFDKKITAIREEAMKRAENAGYDIDPYFFSSNAEFLSGVYGDGTQLRNALADMKLQDRRARSLLDLLIQAIVRLFKGMGLTDPSMLDMLEYEMYKKFQLPITFNSAIQLNDSVQDLLEQDVELARDFYDKQDKTIHLMKHNLDPPRTALLMLKQLGMYDPNIYTDPYEFLQGTSIAFLHDRLYESPQWLEATQAAYHQEENSEGLTLEEFREKMIRMLWNNVNSLVQVPHLKLTTKKNFVYTDDGWIPEITYDISEYGNYFLNKDNMRMSSWTRNMPILDMIKEVSNIVGVELEPYIVESEHEEIFFSGKKARRQPKPTKITKKREWDNTKYIEAFDTQGYIYLGTFADKDKAIVLKKKSPIDNARLNELKRFYQNRYAELRNTLLQAGIPEAELSNYDNRTVFRKDQSLIRTILEDVRLGAYMDNDGLNSVLFDPEYTDTYDLIKMLKRPYAVSEMSYIEVNPQEVTDFLKGADDTGMYLDSNDELQIRSAIFNAENISPEHPLYNYLINKDGVPTTDGAVFYLIDEHGFGSLNRQLQGITREGAMKLWIANKTRGKEFRDPLYIKSAFHGISPNTTLGRMMKKNNLALLISSTASKVHRKPTTDLMDDIDPNNIFDIPYTAMHRAFEGGNVYQHSYGVQQVLTSDFAHERNISFKKANKEHDDIYNKFTDNLLRNVLDKFHRDLTMFDDAGILSFLRDKMVDGTSDYQMTVSGLLSPLLVTKYDEKIRGLKFKHANEKNANERDRLQKEIDSLVHLKTSADITISHKMHTLMEHPYFGQFIKNYFNDLLKDVRKYKSLGTYAHLGPDIGYLNGITDVVKQTVTDYVKETPEYQKDKQHMNSAEMREKINKEIAKYIDPETGRLRKNMIVVSKDIADKFNIKPFQWVITNLVPSNDLRAISGNLVVGIAGLDMSDRGKIYMNSEYVQGLIGRDFDIDSMTLLPHDPDVLSKADYIKLAKFFNKAIDNYESDMLRIYKQVLGDEITVKGMKIPITAETIRSTHSMMEDAEKPLDTKSLIQLAYVQKFNQAVPGTDLYNPAKDFSYIANKFNKRVGDPISRRKNFQLFADINFRSEINGVKISSDHKNAYKIHLLQSILTDHMVDMPTNTASFHYIYDPMIGWMQDNNLLTKSYRPKTDIEDVHLIYSAATATNKFLFGDAIEFMGQYGLDDVSENKYDHNIGLLSSQRNKLNLLKQGRARDLLNLYKQTIQSDGQTYIPTKVLRDPVALNLHFETVQKYLENIDYDALNLENSVMLNTVLNIDPLTFPKVGTTKDAYIRTENLVLEQFLNDPRWKVVKQAMENTFKGRSQPGGEYFTYDSLWAVQGTENIILDEWLGKPFNKLSVEKMLGALWYMTADYSDIHRLKANLIQLVSSSLEYTAREQEMLSKQSFTKHTNSPAAMAVKGRDFAHPRLMKIALRQKTLQFKPDGETKVELGPVTFYRTKADRLEVKYKDKRYDHHEIKPGTELYNLLTSENGVLATQENRQKLQEMFNLRNKINTPLDQRIAEAKEYLTNQLNNLKGKPKEVLKKKILFWTSFMGIDPQVGGRRLYNNQTKQYEGSNGALFGSYRYPTNLIIDMPGSSFQTNNVLLQLMNSVSDPDNTGLKISRFWMDAWTNAHDGITWDDYKNLANTIEQDESVDNYVYFRRGREKILQEKHPKLANFKNLVGLFHTEQKEGTPMPYTDSTGFITYTINFRGHSRPVKGSDISLFYWKVANPSESVSMKLVFNDILPLTYQIDGLKREIRLEMQKFDTFLEDVKLLEDELMKVENVSLKTKYKSLTNDKSILRKEIFKIVQENREKITIRKVNGQYQYYVDDPEYKNPLSPKELPAALGITDGTDKMKKIEIAIKYHELYSVEYPEAVRNIIEHLKDLRGLVVNPNTKTLYDKMIRQYQIKLDKINGRLFRYMPHVYSETTYNTLLLPAIIEHNRNTIRERAKEEKEAMDKYNDPDPKKRSNAPYDETYAINYDNEEWILEEAIKKATDFTPTLRNTVAGFNPFFLKRNLPDELNGEILYDNSSATPHIQHSNQFWQTVNDDLVLAYYLSFEDIASRNGISSNALISARLGASNNSANRYLHNKPVALDQVKPGMEIGMWVETRMTDRDMFERTVNIWHYGTVDRVDDNYIYFKVDRQGQEFKARNEIRQFEAESKRVAGSGDGTRPATALQRNRMIQLRDDGYLNADTYSDDKISGINMEDANHAILQGKINELNDADNWGRVAKADMFIEQYDGQGKMLRTAGVRRYMQHKLLRRAHAYVRERTNIMGEAKGRAKATKLALMPTDKVDNLLVYLYLGNPAAAVRNFTRAHGALMIDDVWSYVAEYRNPFVWMQNSKGAERKAILKDVKTAISQRDFDRWRVIAESAGNFADGERGRVTKRVAQSALKRQLVMDLIIENGLLHDSEMMRIVAESGALDDLTKRNNIIENSLMLAKALSDHSGYGDYIKQYLALNKKLKKAKTPDDALLLKKKIHTLHLNWQLQKQEIEGQIDDIDEKRREELDAMIEERLAKINELRKNKEWDEKKATSVLLENLEVSKPEAMWLMTKLTTSGVLKGLMAPFKTVERAVRISTILLKVNKAVHQGMDYRDYDRLKHSVNNTIGITQGLYDEVNRRMGDRPGLQRGIFKFGHYNYFNAQNLKILYRQGLQQVNNDRKKFFWYAMKGVFRKEMMTDRGLLEERFINFRLDTGEEPTADEKAKIEQQFREEVAGWDIKPGETNIPARVLRSLFTQSWLRTTSIIIGGGLALDSFPAFDVLMDISSTLLSVLDDGDIDDDDLKDWDTRMTLSNIMSFYTGYGITLPAMLTIDAITGEEINLKRNAPTLIRDVMSAYNLIFGEEPDYSFSTAAWTTNQWSKVLLGMKIAPYIDFYGDPAGDPFTMRPITSKVGDIINPLKLPGNLLPLYRELQIKGIDYPVIGKGPQWLR